MGVIVLSFYFGWFELIILLMLLRWVCNAVVECLGMCICHIFNLAARQFLSTGTIQMRPYLVFYFQILVMVSKERLPLTIWRTVWFLRRNEPVAASTLLCLQLLATHLDLTTEWTLANFLFCLQKPASRR